MHIWLIRHGETQGNHERRYIGSTDESLNERGIAQARAFAAPAIDRLFVSPMRRCIETAQIMFPHVPYTVCNGLRECNFGVFEGKTADELADCSAYRIWVASNCTSDVPGGESITAFTQRCCRAFADALEDAAGSGDAAFVIHGGCIMAILAHYEGQRGFYDYRIENGTAVLCESLNGQRLRIIGGAPC